MPGPVLHVGATVLCAHGGQATPTVPNPRVMVSGQPTVTMSGPYAVAGCPFSPGSPSPCGGGGRASLAAHSLQQLGYQNVYAITAPFDEIKKTFG